MKPPVCCVCGRRDATVLVRFANHGPLLSGMPGHPPGLEWACSDHETALVAVGHLASDEAIALVRSRTASRAGRSWWQRWFHWGRNDRR